MNFGTEIPFVTHLGFVLEWFDGGESALGYTPLPEHLNSFAVTHGGVCMTLLDVAMALAARSVQKEMGAVTIEMKSTFMRPAPGDGSKLTARGKLLHRTATLAFTEATLYDAKGQICTQATGTFKYVKRLATSTRSVNSLNAPINRSINSISSTPSMSLMSLMSLTSSISSISSMPSMPSMPIGIVSTD